MFTLRWLASSSLFRQKTVLNLKEIEKYASRAGVGKPTYFIFSPPVDQRYQPATCVW